MNGFVILGIVGSLASIFAVFIWLVGVQGPLGGTRKKISWRKIDGAINRLADSLIAQDWRPDAIIGVGPSGAIVSGILAYNLEAKGFDESAYSFGTVDVKKRSLSFQGASVPAKVERVLLVDSEVYTGATMNAAVQHVRQKCQPREVRTLALFYQVASTHKPTYCAFEVSRVTAMPWEHWSPSYRDEHRRRFWPRPNKTV